MLKDALKSMLEVQELDIQMIRLMRLKHERLAELKRIRSLSDDLHHQVVVKEGEIIELRKQVRYVEAEIADLKSKAQRLEHQQSGVRKVEEFNALTHEISAIERERVAKEQRLSDSYDKLSAEEEFLKNMKQSFEETQANTIQLEKEIKDSVLAINNEGCEIMQRRSMSVQGCDHDLVAIYEKLLRNKKDRVIVPLENRCCSGCHIVVTAQHENIIRKGERLVFCEHCSRIHYWNEGSVESEEEIPAQVTEIRRRRRTVAKGS